jgi:NADH-quinone oxidoreductase subunit E
MSAGAPLTANDQSAPSSGQPSARNDESPPPPLDDAAAEAHAAAEEAHIKQALARLPADATPEEKGNAVGVRPAGIEAARGGTADQLQRIKGVGPVNERRLHELGVFHFDQIGGWTRPEIRWVGAYLAFPGRIDREQWVAQAANLVRGGAGTKDGGPGHPDAKTEP